MQFKLEIFYKKEWGFRFLYRKNNKKKNMEQKSLEQKCPKGNTVPLGTNKKSRDWCFTINNPTEDDWRQMKEIECRYICYAPEIGDNGTPHIQGYVMFNSPRHLSALKKIMPRAHLEYRRGTHDQARLYIVGDYKGKPLNADFTERGTPPEQGKRSDLQSYYEDIKAGKRGRDLSVDHLAMRVKYPRAEEKLVYEEDKVRARKQYDDGMAPEVHVRWGPPGTGKTRKIFEEHTDIYEPTIRKCGTHWWTGYQGEDVILLDEFNGQIPIRDFLRLIDRYPFSMETKGGHVWRLATKIYICSNTPPEEWYPGEILQFEKIKRRLTTVEMIC